MGPVREQLAPGTCRGRKAIYANGASFLEHRRGGAQRYVFMKLASSGCSACAPWHDCRSSSYHTSGAYVFCLYPGRASHRYQMHTHAHLPVVPRSIGQPLHVPPPTAADQDCAFQAASPTRNHVDPPQCSYTSLHEKEHY